MKDLTHNYERFGCKIDADLENTVAVLTDPDGEQQEFVADDPNKPFPEGAKKHTLESAPKNALWHALQAAKADQEQRAEKAAVDAMAKLAKPAGEETDEPTDIDITDVEHVDGASEL